MTFENTETKTFIFLKIETFVSGSIEFFLGKLKNAQKRSHAEYKER